MRARQAHRGSRMTRLAKYTKPLSTSLPPPLTPPSSKQESSTPKSRTVLQDIIREIENRKIGSGFSNMPWLCFELPLAQYKRLEQRYKNDGFVQDKLRYDYFPSISRFVLRMPRLFHEQLALCFVTDLQRKFDSIASGTGPAATFAEKIRPTNSVTIEFNTSHNTKHSSDASFKHLDAKYPGVVMEVSYSQKRQDLPRLAQDYITRSNGAIKVVVGIDLDYKGKEATLSVWRAQIRVSTAGRKRLHVQQTLSDQEIRSANGNPNNDTQSGLRLRLRDFGPRLLAGRAVTLNEELFISSATLSGYVVEAELADAMFRGAGQDIDFDTDFDVIQMDTDEDTLSQESTPSDELDEEDERRYQWGD